MPHAYARLIDWQIEEGVDGIVPVGTTGESATLDHDEHVEVIRLGVEAARGRVARSSPGPARIPRARPSP